MRRLQYLIIISAIIGSIWVARERIRMEVGFKEVDLAIDYKMAKNLGLQYGLGEMRIFKAFKEAGVTSVVVYEDTLETLHDEGYLSLVSTNELLGRERIDTFTGFSLNPRFLRALLGPNATYIITKDRGLFEHLRNILPSKVYGYLTTGREAGLHVIEIEGMGERFKRIGVGFLPSRIKTLSGLGLNICIIPNNYGSPSEESIDKIFKDVCNIFGVNRVLFKDKPIGYPDHIQTTISNLNRYGLELAVLESQIPPEIRSICQKMPHLVVRTHMIKGDKMDKQHIARLVHALKEGNIRSLYLMPILQGGDDLVKLNVEYVKSIKEGLIDEGFRIGTKNTIQNKTIPTPLLFLIGLGILLTVISIMDRVTTLYFGQRVLILIVSAAILGLGLWSRVFLQKSLVLITSILFPILAILMVKPGEGQGSLIGTIGRRIRLVLLVCGVTSLGALFVIGLMSETQYILGIDEAFGVRFALLLPVFGVWVSCEVKEKGIGGLLSTPIQLSHLLLFVMVLIILNYEFIHPFKVERHLFMWVRFLSFLIGYPALFFAIHLIDQGYRGNLLLIIGTISQTSLMNTYLHLDTPILLSITRTIAGFIIGGIIGILLIIGYWLTTSRDKVYGEE